MKTLVLGIGNPILSDDGVGIKVAIELKSRLRREYFDVKVASIEGLSILDEITGYDRLILIDSIKTGKGAPGDVYKLSLEDLGSTSHLSSSHGVDFVTVIELGRKVGYKIPEIIDIYAIEVKDNTTFGEECTEKVRMRIPEIADEIISDYVPVNHKIFTCLSSGRRD